MRNENKNIWWRLRHGDVIDWMFGALFASLGALIAVLIAALWG